MGEAPGLLGRRFGPYLLEAPLGRGGMGEVYRASHLHLPSRRAAVKVLPVARAQDLDFLRRFALEANNVAALDHPNILPLWDYGEQDGLPYLAMPLVTGGSLRELLAERGPLSPAEAESFIRPIAEALDHAHAAGIIHRDVKPANILLRGDGRPLLADFGIAKAAEQGPGVTGTGVGVGTPEYMAPEQIEGQAVPRSDLYSLAIMLYEMLTGRVPYSGATPYAVALRHLRDPLPPITETNPRLPTALGPVLARALAKNAAERYASGREFADAVRAALAEPVPVGGGPSRPPAPPFGTLPTVPTRLAVPATVNLPAPAAPSPSGSVVSRPLIWGALAALLALCVVGSITTYVLTRGQGAGVATIALGAAKPTATSGRGAATPGGQVPTLVSAGTARTTAPAPPGDPEPGDWGPSLAPLPGGNLREDSAQRFSLRVPSEWIEFPPSGNIVLAFIGPLSATPPTMNVYLEAIDNLPDRSLETFAQRSTQVSESQLRADYPDFALVSRDRVMINGLPAYRQVFIATISGQRLQVAQIFFVDPTRPVAHIMTFGTLPSSFAQYATVFDQIAGSYEVKPE